MGVMELWIALPLLSRSKLFAPLKAYCNKSSEKEHRVQFGNADSARLCEDLASPMAGSPNAATARACFARKRTKEVHANRAGKTHVQCTCRFLVLAESSRKLRDSP